MTTQEAYEKIRDYFSRPKAVLAVDSFGNCFYRGDGDPNSPIRCAVGCLIPDERYNRDWENKSIFEIQPEIPELEEVDCNFLMEAQYTHDEGGTAEGFLHRLDYVAQAFDLHDPTQRERK